MSIQKGSTGRNQIGQIHIIWWIKFPRKTSHSPTGGIPLLLLLFGKPWRWVLIFWIFGEDFLKNSFPFLWRCCWLKKFYLRQSIQEWTIVRKGVPAPLFLRHPPLNTACRLPPFLTFVSPPLFSLPLPFKVFYTVPPPSRNLLLVKKGQKRAKYLKIWTKMYKIWKYFEKG